MMPYRVILADDHAMFRGGVKRMLERIPGIEIVGEAVDGLELLRLLEDVPADLVLLDLSMPNLGGIEAARLVSKAAPSVKILILTMHKSKEYFYYSMSAGASGYLLKQDADEELVAAIEKIRGGEAYISPLLSEELLDDVATLSRGGVGVLPAELSAREKEVLVMIARGRTSREIAGELHLSVRTVEHHRANIMKKTKMKNIADLVRFAFRQGFVT